MNAGVLTKGKKMKVGVIGMEATKVAVALAESNDYVIDITQQDEMENPMCPSNGLVAFTLLHDHMYAYATPVSNRKESVVSNPCLPRRWKKGSKR
jgi:hypothetical protein